MPSIRNVGGSIRYSIERFDGGLDTKASPSKIGPFETPECLNVVFDVEGAVATRDGSAIFNTAAIATLPVNYGISYQTTMVVFANNAMYRASGTAFVKVTTSSGKFDTANHKVAAKVYQNVLFASDGVNGPWKWTGGENFYNMGIDLPSAPAGSGTSAGSISTGTYYYAISNVNTQVVESEIGSVSAGITIAGSSTIGLFSIPVGSTLAGVNTRRVYRAEASSGPFRRVGTISDNTTTTFVDTVANGAEGALPVEDSTKPTPFNTIELHKERLFFDDTAASFVRWTDFQNPYISSAENSEPIDRGDGDTIQLIASQDDFVIIFKDNSNTSIETADPSDITTWIKRKSPANLGAVGPRALAYIQNGAVFVGRQYGKMTGLHVLSGIQVAQTYDGRLRSLSISGKIEYDILNQVNTSLVSGITLSVYKNRLYMAYPFLGSTNNDRIFWLDTNRFVPPNEPGSWAPWKGINAQHLFVHNGHIYSGDSTSTGFVRQLEAGAYGDSGGAIDSYFWTKEIGGEDAGALDCYVKDLRKLYVWHAKVGAYNMNVNVRTDGDTGNGQGFLINLDPTGSTWGSMIWGVDPWGGVRTDLEDRITLGKMIGQRFQVRFSNQNVLNQGFKVHRIELEMNTRRRR